MAIISIQTKSLYMNKQSNHNAFSGDQIFLGTSASLQKDFGIPLSLILNLKTIMAFKHTCSHVTSISNAEFQDYFHFP